VTGGAGHAGASYLSGVTEILFYHMQRQPLEAVLPSLLEKSLERQWRVAIQAASEERLQALDDHLWTFSEESFLPHGTDRDGDAATQPVVLTLRDANPNAASIRFLVEGAALPDDAGTYERIVILFDGNDRDALLHAREQWRGAKEAGHAVAYWQQDESGRWQKKA
jgi:DNA polymerase-3 subunit chi